MSFYSEIKFKCFYFLFRYRLANLQNNVSKKTSLIEEENEDEIEEDEGELHTARTSSSSASDQKGQACSSGSSTSSSRGSKTVTQAENDKDAKSKKSVKSDETLTESPSKHHREKTHKLIDQHSPVKSSPHRSPKCRPPAKPPITNGNESEHIYESIPDVSVSESEEPIYSVPYDPGQIQNKKFKLKQPELLKVMSHPNSSNKTDTRGTRSSGTSSSSGGSSSRRGSSRASGDRQKSLEHWVKEGNKSSKNNKDSANMSIASTSSPTATTSTSTSKIAELPMEERDSSSAYNTGDSTGSTHQPVGLELSLGQDPSLRQSTLTLCPPTNDQSLQVIIYQFLTLSGIL